MVAKGGAAKKGQHKPTMPLGVDDLKNLLRPGAAPGKANKLPAKRGRNKGAKVFADIRQVEYDADLFVRGALRAQPPPPRGKPLGKLVKPRVSTNPARPAAAAAAPASSACARGCLLYTSPSPRDRQKSRMPSSA